MNILHLSPYYPSVRTNHAGGICMAREIRTLSEKNRVFALSFAASAFDRELMKKDVPECPTETVEAGKAERLLGVLRHPLLPACFAARSSGEFRKKLLLALKEQKIDAIHAEYAAMGQYLDIKKDHPELKTTLVLHDVTAQSWERKRDAARGLRRLFLSFELARIRKYEGLYCRMADEVLTFNEKDRALTEQLYGVKARVINTWFGLEDDPAARAVPREAHSICFVGQMGREENWRAAMRLVRIAKSLREEFPDLKVYIVGTNPPEELRKLSGENVLVTGFVEDVDEYFRRSALSVFPLELGAGIKVKVLRSLALGTPVVTGAVGAEGIDREGTVICLAETDEEYKSAIRACLLDPEGLSERGKQSAEYVRRNFGWQRTREVFDELYNGGST